VLWYNTPMSNTDRDLWKPSEDPKFVYGPPSWYIKSQRIKSLHPRSPELTNEQAWRNAQPKLAEEVYGYPNIHFPFGDIIREVFNERRRACLATAEEGRLGINEDITAKIRSLDPTTIDLLAPVFTVIRNMFEVQSPTHRNYKSQRK
jgi:hypothetical protein